MSFDARWELTTVAHVTSPDAARNFEITLDLFVLVQYNKGETGMLNYEIYFIFGFNTILRFAHPLCII